MNLATWQDMVSRALIDGDTSPFAALDEDLPWRIEVYLDSYLGNYAEGLSDHYPFVAAWVRTQQGKERWGQLIRTFQREHPPQSDSRIVALAPFPAFLASQTELPPWLADVARLHSAARIVNLAPDQAAERVEPTARIDSFQWDVLAWCGDGEPDLDAEPEARPNMVVTWRAEDLCPRHAEVGLLEAQLIEILRRGDSPDPAFFAELEVDAEDIGAALEALTEAGLLREWPG